MELLVPLSAFHKFYVKKDSHNRIDLQHCSFQAVYSAAWGLMCRALELGAVA